MGMIILQLGYCWNISVSSYVGNFLEKFSKYVLKDTGLPRSEAQDMVLKKTVFWNIIFPAVASPQFEL